MGQRGPAPLPANVHLLKGNPSKRPLGELLGELKVPAALPDMPENIAADPVAREEWERIGPELLELGLVSEIDRSALMAYCMAYSEVIRCDQMIRRKNNFDPEGIAGMVVRTPSGYMQQSPWVQMRNRAAEAMKGWLREFGMTPSARSRVTPSDGGQLPLPGMGHGGDPWTKV
jgi:P27 family predicted phage terminase small subunit